MSQMQAGQYLHTAGTQPLTTTDGKLNVRASEIETILNKLASENKLEQARALLETLADTDYATEATLAQTVEKLQALLDRLEQAVPVSVKGSLPAIWGADVAERPPANEVPVGQQFILANENLDAWVSNGTEWVVI